MADDDDDEKFVDYTESRSEFSLSPRSPDHQPDANQSEELLSSLDDQIDEILHIDDENSEINRLITDAQQQEFNCLDLSKRQLAEFPSLLLKFPSLQYLYLEGNQIQNLPDDLFVRLPNLKWIDLRNNQLTQLPHDGLAKHGFLRYLLLGDNSIRTLPAELGKLKGLSALNLDGNPLDHPPADIVQQGIKAIQHFLRDEHRRQLNLESDEDEEQQIDLVADVWASSDDEQQAKPKSAPSSKKTPASTTSKDPVGDAFAARAREEQQNRRLKHRNIKIDEELQKVKNRDSLNEWKDDYRSTQQQLRRKRLVKGKDYQEPVVQAPFGIDPHYIPIMNTDQQAMLEKAVRYESRRNRSPESALREEEERRTRDRQIQERIREITGKMLKRRAEPRGNAVEEKRQAELELRELRKLESEVKKRRTQIDTRFKAYTGDVKARKRL